VFSVTDDGAVGEYVFTVGEGEGFANVDSNQGFNFTKRIGRRYAVQLFTEEIFTNNVGSIDR